MTQEYERVMLYLKRIRREQGISMDTVAEIGGLTKQTVINVESMRTSVRTDTLIMYCKGIGISILDAFKESEMLIEERYNKPISEEYKRMVNVLAQERHEQRMTQRQLADKVGCSHYLISIFESRKSVVNGDLLYRITKELGLTFAELERRINDGR